MGISAYSIGLRVWTQVRTLRKLAERAGAGVQSLVPTLQRAQSSLGIVQYHQHSGDARTDTEMHLTRRAHSRHMSGLQLAKSLEAMTINSDVQVRTPFRSVRRQVQSMYASDC